MLGQIQTIERHMKYLRCLHFIEECRYFWVEEDRTVAAVFLQT